MPTRVEACPNCDHVLAMHGLTADASADAPVCKADGCRCALDRASARLAMAVAAALVKFG